MIRRAVILAGGKGTRLHPVTLEIPKPLIPVQGKAIATWQSEWLFAAGIERITMTIPVARVDQFEAWRQEQKNPERIDFIVEDQPLGTLGALVHLVKDLDQPTIITNGDELKGLDLERLVAFHGRQESHKDPVMTLALRTVSNPSSYGIAEMEGERIVRYHEKPEIPPSNLMNAGLYIADPSVFDQVDRSKTSLMFEMDLFPQLAASGQLFGCELAGAWYDCGTFERWETAIKEWKSTE